MRGLIALASLSVFAATAIADGVIYEQPHNLSNALHQSSWWEPNDSDYDQWVWDSFVLNANQAITRVTWRGGYLYGGMYTGTIADFTVSIYPSITANTEPDIVHPPLVTYQTSGDASESIADVYGGVTMYDYQFTLPSAFQATAGTKYWIQIEAWQSGIPEWCLAGGSGGNGSHFRWVRGLHMYQSAPGDAAFALYSATGTTYAIDATAYPINGGTITGTGQYPAGSTASLSASANPGFGFINWTETGVPVSNSANYTFTVNGNRDLVANFATAYTITTSSMPTSGGTTSGGGTFLPGTPVTVTATPNYGYVFVDWTEFGNTVSTSPTYMFPAGASRTLIANFMLDPQAVMFNFDNAPVHTSLPIDVTVSGLIAHLSATGSGFSIQSANSMGLTPAGFSGLCIYPNSVFAADLIVGFSETLTDFSILYSPQELGCDDSARMRVTAYMDGVAVGTQTTTAPFPGTWPSHTLSISVPAGFNSAIVHYDARPPTCQDWGPIFLADNMQVVRVPFDCLGVNNCSGHGTCTGLNTCSCDGGWSGAACDIANCAGVADCSGHGLCVAPDSCSCDAGWTGPDCATAAPFPCLANTDCVLANADICNFHECVGGFCTSTPIHYGNVNGSAFQVPNLDDILCVLAGFASFGACPNADIAGPTACQGDGIINLDDILAVLSAFGGADPCHCEP